VQQLRHRAKYACNGKTFTSAYWMQYVLPMTWKELHARLLALGRVLEERNDEIGMAVPCSNGERPIPVAVRRVTAQDREWIHVFAAVGAMRDVALAAALREGAGMVVGDVGIEGDCCVVREKVALVGLAHDALDVLIVTLSEQARALRRTCATGSMPHPYADLYLV
jgi:hypothetical protein